MVPLLPTYYQKLKTGKPAKGQVKACTAEASEVLNGCIDCTDWEGFLEVEDNLDAQVEKISASIEFRIAMIIPVKEGKDNPNNKPWITKGIADILKQRQQAFEEGSTKEVKAPQKEARNLILQNKKKIRDKLEDSLRSNNPGQM